MAEHVRQIKDSNGDLVYPKTKVAAISDFDTESHLVNRNQSSGVVEFPTLTDNLNGSFTVGSYKARFFIGNDFTGDIRQFDVPGGTFTPTQYILSYLVADYNAGSPVTRLITDVSLITEANVIPVSTVYRHELDIHHMTWDHLGLGLSNKLHQRLVKTQRFARESGLMISESTGRYMQITAGAVWYGAVRVALEACNSNVHGFHLYYHVAGSWITQSDHISVYNNTQYDNGTALVNANPNTYLINWLYRGVEPEQHVYMVLGSQAYGKLGDAQLAQPRSDLPVEIVAHAMLIGKIIVKQGDSVASAIQSVFDLAFVSTESGGATTHNDLAGLQGGTVGEYYHLSLTIYTDLTDGGDSTLHYHSSDRNRANHTGTQSADTLIDGTTNKVYTAVEKTKLAGIEAGAEVNNISDVNATDLTDLGDSALHYHSADRNRSNHTGTQSADTIVDGTTNKAYTATEKTKLAGIEAGAEVNNISDVNAADLTDLGDSSLHYHSADRNRANHTGTQSADTIVDGTTNKAYTATEKTKLAGIEAGAEVNNISDVNATDLTDGGASTLHYHTADRARANHTGTQSADTLTDGSTNKVYTATEQNKLSKLGALFIGYKNSTTSMATAADVKIAIDTTYTNTDTALYSMASGQLTVSEAGTYLIQMMASVSSGTDGARMVVTPFINGSGPIYGGQTAQVASKIIRCFGSITLSLAANDVIALYAYQDSGVSKTCNGGTVGNFLMVTKLG